jgi:hypothetical protein
MTTAATISEPAEQPVPTTAHSTTTAASVGPGRRLPQPSERAMAMRRPVMATKAPGYCLLIHCTRQEKPV